LRIFAISASRDKDPIGALRSFPALLYGRSPSPRGEPRSDPAGGLFLHDEDRKIPWAYGAAAASAGRRDANRYRVRAARRQQEPVFR
jgi:hypothetical protein